MSATNSTTHYNLPSFVGSDKPAWLVDWNGAMAAIDSAIYEAKSTADQAVTAAGAVASDLATLSGTVTTQGNSITTLSETLTTAVGNINTINGNITTINSLIGNGTPTTTDQTIIGAINEINANLTSVTADVNGTVLKTVTADGVKTPAEILNEFVTILSGLTAEQKYKTKLIYGTLCASYNNTSVNDDGEYSVTTIGPTGNITTTVFSIAANASKRFNMVALTDGTFSISEATSAPSSGLVIKLIKY